MTDIWESTLLFGFPTYITTTQSAIYMDAKSLSTHIPTREIVCYKTNEIYALECWGAKQETMTTQPKVTFILLFRLITRKTSYIFTYLNRTYLMNFIHSNKMDWYGLDEIRTWYLQYLQYLNYQSRPKTISFNSRGGMIMT